MPGTFVSAYMEAWSSLRNLTSRQTSMVLLKVTATLVMLLHWLELIVLKRKPKCLSIARNTLLRWLFFSYSASSFCALHLKLYAWARSRYLMSIQQTCALSSSLPLPLVVLILQRAVWRSFPPACLPDHPPWSLGWTSWCVLRCPLPFRGHGPSRTLQGCLLTHPSTPQDSCSWGQDSQFSCSPRYPGA